MIRFAIILSLSLLFSINVKTQSISNEEARLALAKQKLDFNIDSAFALYKNILGKSTTIKSIYEAKLGIINCLTQKNQIDTSFELIANMYNELSSQSDSSYYYKLALLNARVLLAVGSFDNAIKLAVASNRFFTILKDTPNIYNSRYIELAIYQNFGKKDTAMLLSKQVEKQIVNNQKERYKDYYTLFIAKAYLYRDFGDNFKSNQTLFPILNNLFKIGNRYVPNVCLLLSENYFKLKQYDSSNYYAKKGIEKSTALGLKNQLEILYYRKFFADSALGNKEMAIQDLRLAIEIQRSSFSDAKGKILKEYKLKLDKEKLVTQNAELNANKKNFLIVIVAGLLVLGFIFIILIILKRKNDTLNQLVNFKDFVFTIIAHDLRSPFLAFQNLASQINFLIENGETDNLKKISIQIDKSSTNISNILDNLLAINYTRENIATKKYNQIVNLQDAFNDVIELHKFNLQQKNLKVCLDLLPNASIETHLTTFKIILRNCIDNLIKHNTGNLEVRVIKNEIHTELQLLTLQTDFNKEQIAKINLLLAESKKQINGEIKSLGLRLIGFFCSQLKWKISFDQRNGKYGYIIVI